MIKLCILLVFFAAGCAPMPSNKNIQGKNWDVFGEWTSADGYKIKILVSGKYQFCSSSQCESAYHSVSAGGLSTKLEKFCLLKTVSPIKDKITNCDDHIISNIGQVEKKSDIEFFPSYFKRDCSIQVGVCVPMFKFEESDRALFVFRKVD
jgi:hypothetical protein